MNLCDTMDIGCDSVDVESVIAYLNNSNRETEKTLITGFVNEITVKYLPLYVLETFTINKEVQRIVMSLSEQHIKNLSKIINYAESMDQDWIPLCVNYYHFLNNDKFANLVNKICDCELDQSQIEKLLFIINDSCNYFNIQSVDNLNNLSEIRNKMNDRNNNISNLNVLLYK